MMLETLRGRLANWINPNARITESSELFQVYGTDFESAAGVSVTARSAMRHAAVYACIRILGESIGTLPLQVMERDGKRKEKATDHPLYSLLHDSPNGIETSFESRESSVTDLNLRGNAYYLKNESRARNRIEELVPFHPDIVEVTRGDDLRGRYKVRDGGVKPSEYTADQIWHIRGQSRDRLTGLSPIAVQRDTVGLGLAQNKYGSQLYKNGAKGSGLLTTPPFKDDEKRQRFRDQFEASVSGENAHRTIHLEFPEGKYERISMTAEDAQFLESQKMTRTQIASIFRVPPHMIADLEKATFSNIEQQSLEFVIYSLLPWCTRIEQSANMHLLRPEERGRFFVKFNLAGFLRGDTKSRAEFYKAMDQVGAFNPNTILELEDMNPREDEGGDEYRRTANTVSPDLEKTEANANA